MKDFPMTQVQALLNGYSQRSGFDPNNHIDQKNMKTLDEARDMYERGQKFSLLFGPPTEPTCHVEIFQTASTGKRRIDVDFFEKDVISNGHILEHKAARFEHTRDEILYVQGVTNFGKGGKYTGSLRTHDVLTDGDLPRLSISGESFAVSVPWQDFYMGPMPSFDELSSGEFIARLPIVTMPPDALLDTYIPQKHRKPSDPKRTPKGRFLNGEWVVGSA